MQRQRRLCADRFDHLFRRGWCGFLLSFFLHTRLTRHTVYICWCLTSKVRGLKCRHVIAHFDSDRTDISFSSKGTLMFVASKFQKMRTPVPPMMTFGMGSLGFLTPFSHDAFKTSLKAVLHGLTSVTLRMRLKCEIVRAKRTAPEDFDPDELAEAADWTSPNPQSTFAVLNELVVDRGPSPYISNLEVLCDGMPVTRVQGDGIIVATPTGSTAYSVSAGGSMVHPTVPCIMLTPICPHSLSFRPIIVPSTVELQIRVPEGSRNGAWVSMDGQNRQQLRSGDYVRVTSSASPIPTVNLATQSSDWFNSLSGILNWNKRDVQKASSSSATAAE
jgi:NAD+ kinase